MNEEINSGTLLPIMLRSKDIVDSKLQFPVVGIGASAGGLAALRHFFEIMPAKNGMAFVVIVHLSPTHESTLDSLLQQVTGMPVLQITESTHIEKDHVYVIAPNRYLVMEDDLLQEREFERSNSGPITIDIFFRTLADTHRERAIAVVMSGMGADGSLGIGRIKEQGGVVIVQSLQDAEYESMPLASIETGFADFVLPLTEIPQKLLSLFDNMQSIRLPEISDMEHLTSAHIDPRIEAEAALKKIIELLKLHKGHDFRYYKLATVLRRIERRLQVCSVATLPDYLDFLQSNPSEYEALLKDMLISVTQFFRDRSAFETLEREVIPKLFEDKKKREQVRVWSAACATGEEPYSIAILLKENAALFAEPPQLQIFATDIDEQAIGYARTGRYPAAILTDVPPTRLRTFFNKQENHYQVQKLIRESILFVSHNLLSDPPFSRLDLICCRNLLIYLNREIHTHVLELFHFALKPGGYLFLGNSESAEGAAHLFKPIDKKSRIYQARVLSRSIQYTSAFAEQTLEPLQSPNHVKKFVKKTKSFADIHQRSINLYAPASVMIDQELNILYMSDRMGRFLRYVGGEPSRNLLTLILSELRLELRTAIFQMQRNNTHTKTRPTEVNKDNEIFFVSMTVQPIADELSNSHFILIFFEETPQSESRFILDSTHKNEDLILNQLEMELQQNKELLQERIEHAEISAEEFKAANEELQALNEELHAATEELETSKEELQSVNEELITVNQELKLKIEEIVKTNDDLNNLIAATDIATIFVDKNLCIKRYTPRAKDLFSIIATDVGRSLLDLRNNLDYPELENDAIQALENLHLIEREVRHTGNRFYIVRLLPYQLTEGRIDGIVMTFFDITARRLAEAQLSAGNPLLLDAPAPESLEQERDKQ